LWYIIDERRAYSVDSENFQRTVLERLEGLKKGQERLESKVDGLEGRLNELEAKNATRHLQIETKLEYYNGTRYRPKFVELCIN